MGERRPRRPVLLSGALLPSGAAAVHRRRSDRVLGGDTNLYAYVGADPLSESDPFGLCGIEDLPRIPQPVVDAVAGFGDSLSFSATRAFRDFVGINDQVDQCSWSYTGGEIASLVVGLGRVGYAGAAKALPLMVRSGRTQLERALAVSAVRNILKRGFRLNPWSTSRIYSAEQVLQKYGSNPAAIIAAATRTDAAFNGLGAAAAAGVIVNYAAGPSCKKSKSEQ